MYYFGSRYSGHRVASLSAGYGMRIKAAVILTLIVSSFFLTFGFKNLFAENAGMDVSARITRLIQQVDEIEKKQQQIIVTENKIVEEINNLKIQSRR